MAKIWSSLFGGGGEAQPESRLSLTDYANQYFTYKNNGYPVYPSGGYAKDIESIEHDFESYVADAYKSNGVVYACMVARARLFTQPRFQWQKMNKGRPGDLFGTPELGVLEEPWRDAGTMDLLNRAITHVDLSGNHYAVRERNRIRVLRPDWVDVILTSPPEEAVESDIAGWRYRPGGTTDRLVSFVDLAPTLLSTVGVRPPEWMQGHAFMGPDEAAPRTNVVQIIAININGLDGARAPKAPVDPGAHDGGDAREDASHGGDPAGGGDPPQVGSDGEPQGDAPLRFANDVAIPFKMALKDQINVELKRPGPAKGVQQRVEREIVPALNRRILGLKEDDPQLQNFARNAGLLVAGATSQEEYAGLITKYSGAAVDQARGWIQAQAAQVIPIGTGIAGFVFDFFMVLMLTAFFLVFFPRIRDYMRDLVSPQFRDDYGKVLTRIDRRLSGAIRGQVIICLINAALTFPGLWFIGTHSAATTVATYSVLLSVVAGVLSMIPIFGVILSTVPMVILALTQHSVGGALLVIAWISVIHAIEAYLLNPNILGHSASMNPIIVVFALLAGKQFGGLTGALLAVPIASVIVSLFGYYRRLVAESYATETGGAVPVDDWDD